MITPDIAERELLEGYLMIPDAHERLTAIVDDNTGPGIPEAERSEGDLVPGCVSRVWLTARGEGDKLHLRWDADSPMIKGLAGLICRIYDGLPLATACVYDAGVIAGLGLDRQLSPSRLNGLGALKVRIRTRAGELAAYA